MLRESSKIEGNDVDLQVIISGSEGQEKLPAERELVAFAEAALGDDQTAIADARSQLTERIGTDGMIDSACVIANFQRMVCIADGTGIPLDTPVAIITAGIRDELGINNFSTAENTPEIGFLKRILGIIITPLLPFIFRGIAKQSQEQGHS